MTTQTAMYKAIKAHSDNGTKMTRAIHAHFEGATAAGDKQTAQLASLCADMSLFAMNWETRKEVKLLAEADKDQYAALRKTQVFNTMGYITTITKKLTGVVITKHRELGYAVNAEKTKAAATKATKTEKDPKAALMSQLSALVLKHGIDAVTAALKDVATPNAA